MHVPLERIHVPHGVFFSTSHVSLMYHLCTVYVPCLFHSCSIHVRCMFHSCCIYIPYMMFHSCDGSWLCQQRCAFNSLQGCRMGLPSAFTQTSSPSSRHAKIRTPKWTPSDAVPGLFLEVIWCHFGLLSAAPDYETPKCGFRLIFVWKFDACFFDDPSKIESTLDGQLT